MGLTALYKDYKDDKKLKTDKTIFHTGATAWGLCHLALEIEGLSKTKWMTGWAKGNGFIKNALMKVQILGVVGAELGFAGGVLMVYRTWRTDKDTIKAYFKEGKKKLINLGRKINKKLKKIFDVNGNHVRRYFNHY